MEASDWPYKISARLHRPMMKRQAAEVIPNTMFVIFIILISVTINLILEQKILVIFGMKVRTFCVTITLTFVFTGIDLWHTHP